MSRPYFQVWIYSAELANFCECRFKAEISAEMKMKFSDDTDADADDIWKIAEQIVRTGSKSELDDLANLYDLERLYDDRADRNDALIGHVADELLMECSRTLLEY